MKVLMLADGRAIHTVRFQGELVRQGVDVILASLERGDTVDIQLKKKSVSISLNYFLVNREIKELVRKIEADIVSAHFASGYGFSAALSGVWKKIPIVLHCLGSDILISPRKSVAHKRRVVYGLSKASHIFVDSRYLAKRVLKLCPAKNLDVIPWGTEVEMLNLYEKRMSRSILKRRPLKVLVPRPHNRIYNNEFIIKSLRELINKKQIAFYFPDWGDNRNKFKRTAKEACPDGTVEYYHLMPRSEYIEFISKFDIYLSASRSDSSPASLIDAMAAGLFPVVANIPGVREWIGAKSGILFEQNDSKSLQDSLVRLLNLDVDVKKVLAANHEKVIENGLFSENIKKTIGIMERVCGCGR